MQCGEYPRGRGTILGSVFSEIRVYCVRRISFRHAFRAACKVVLRGVFELHTHQSKNASIIGS